MAKTAVADIIIPTEFEKYAIERTAELSRFGASGSQYVAAFGDLQWWWFGERGSPRIDQSKHVAFLNDQIAVRFIEELDFDYQSLEAVSVMKTPAA